jgi:dolichol-phosphate mannosyltransferase
MKKISLVIPAYNEEVNIPIIREKIQEVFQAQLPNYSYEIIFVNDGSRDQTQVVLEKLAQNFPEVKYLEFSRNFGHQAALKAGLNHVEISSNAAISLDCDLQHPPSFIPQLVEKWEEGYDLVFTLRRYDVSESFFKKFTSNLYYNILAKLSDFKFERGEGADFKLYDAKVLEEIKNNNESDLFLRGFSKWIGFKQVGINFDAGIRENGVSQYTINKMFALALAGITSFSVKPLYFAAYLGLFFSLMSLVYIPYVVYAFVSKTEISGWASLISTVVFFGGLQLSILGIIGIYLGKIFTQVKERPLYIVRSKNF